MTNDRLHRIRPGLVLAGILAAAAAVAAQKTEQAPEDVTVLTARFEDALGSGDYAAALALAERRNDLAEPAHVEALYDLARAHALLGHNEDAYAWLQRAKDAGYADAFRLRRDDAFKSLRDEDRFKALARSIWARSYIAMLERPERVEFQKPERVMATLSFKRGERVADIGAGSGYFTIPVARAVGPDGVVWAIDIAQEMLDHLAARLEKEQVGNVRLVKVEKDDPRLPPAGVDTILMIDTLHYVQDRAAYARKLRAGLAPGGRVVIIDYRPKPFEERPWGPPPEQQISKADVDAAMAAAGLVPVRVHEFLPEQYFVEYVAAP